MSEPAANDNNNGNTTPAPHSPEDSVERAFALLKEAKSLESKTKFWKASEIYVQAQQLLQALADEASQTTSEEENYEEQQQIAKLYRDKAQEYWSHSRRCLIQAMEQEKKKDESDAGKNDKSAATPSCYLIDDDQAKARSQTFTTLFSRPIADEVMVADPQEDNIIDQQWSIEERLQELNKSLPSGFKTDEERMAEINKGLNKLGLSLPHTQQAPFARFQDTLPKSEEEQIDDILAQAQDEAAFEQHAARMNGIDGATEVPLAKTQVDDDAGLSDDEDSDDEPGDEMLEDDQLAIKKIRKKVAKTQIKIAELVALLDKAKAATDKEHQPITKETVLKDDNSDGTSDAETFLEAGKKKLRSAQRDLRKALEEWNDAILVVNSGKPMGRTMDHMVSPPVINGTDDDDDDDEAPDLIAIDEDADNVMNEQQETVAVSATLLPPCPVTILSGFLGSGKTTLIQYILTSPDHGKRIAVIENEFGEGLAVESLIARDGVDPQSDSLQDFIELGNGCICCSVKDSLVTTLESLLEKRSDLDYILIEASGMANPGPIASVFWLDDAVGSRLKLDGIVTLVDAVHILEQLGSTEEAAQQIAYADRIILNKEDLLDQEISKTTAAQVENKIRELNPSAPILRTSFSRIPDLDWILNADCFGGSDRLEELETIWGNVIENDTTTSQDEEHSRAHHHDHDHHDDCKECHEAKQQHKHTVSISTVALHHQGSVDLGKLNSWLAEILWPNQDETDEVLSAMLHNSGDEKAKQKDSTTQQIFRIKGILSAFFRDEDEDDPKVRKVYRMEENGLDRRRFILQAVHDLWECYPASDEALFESEEERVGKMVVIGMFLKEDELKAGFASCFVEKS